MREQVSLDELGKLGTCEHLLYLNFIHGPEFPCIRFPFSHEKVVGHLCRFNIDLRDKKVVTFLDEKLLSIKKEMLGQ